MINKKYVITLGALMLLGISYVGAQAGLPFLNHSVLSANAAAADYYLEIDGIDGESTDQGHQGEIELNSWSWGESQVSTHGGGGGGAGKVSMQDFHFTMDTSKASPKLMLAVATGEHFKKATLVARKMENDRPQEYLVITLTDVMVSSYQIAGDGTGIVPTDQISLNFSKIEFEYKSQNPDGSAESVKTGWDLGKNKKI